jgi:phosphopantothenoylcysteine decarboxylase / phosphopantothenate---cysteine ligase
MSLEGRRVVLGISGGIAAYKAIEVCRRLVDAGAHVQPVMTESATRFVGPTTFSALASEPVRMSLFDDAEVIPHTQLGQGADAMVIAPATARLIGSYAAGISDDLLTATLLATEAPVVLCPAMHTEMWEHAAVQANIATLEERGVIIVPPEDGRLAGGDIGRGRLAAPVDIVAAVDALFSVPSLAGVHVVVSAGGTREPIDPVRYIANRSTGKQGHALAAQARARGAQVTLVSSSSLPAPHGVHVVEVETAREMHDAVMAVAEHADVVIMAAAVADFRPLDVAESKLKKASGPPEFVLEPTIDILAALGKHRPSTQVLVGFAAETDDLVANARRKLTDKNADMIVANDVSEVGAGFANDTNHVVIVTADEAIDIPLTSKHSVAAEVLDRVGHCLVAKRAEP